MTFEKLLRSVSRAASQRLGILRKSWRSLHDRTLLGDAFWVLACPFWSTVLLCSVRLPIDTLNYWTVQSVVPSFLLGVCLSMTLLIVDQWRSCVCFTRSGVTRCTLLMVLYLDRMCQCGLYAVLWSHIGSLMHLLAAEPRSTAGLLFPSQCPFGTILLTLYSIVWDRLVSRAGPMFFFIVPKLFIGTIFNNSRLFFIGPYNSLLLFFPFHSFCL